MRTPRFVAGLVGAGVRTTGAWLMCLCGAWAACGQEPGGLARYVPRDDLSVYLEHTGLDRHAEAWRRTAAYRMLNETTAGAMLRDVVTQLADRLVTAQPVAKLTGADAVTLALHVARSGFVVANVGKPNAAGTAAVVVLRGAARLEDKERFEGLLRAAAGPGAKTQLLTRQDGRKIVLVRSEGGEGDGAGWAFWTENEDIVVAIGRPEESPDQIIDTLEGKHQSATTHPVVAELAHPENGFEPVTYGFLDLAIMPDLPPAIGLAGARRLDYRWGFSGDTLMSVTRILAPQPRQGLLSFFDQPTLDASTFPPLPAGLQNYTAFSLDLGRSYDKVVATLRATDPNAEQGLRSVSAEIQRATGLRLKEDLLAHLGPRMAFYIPSETINVPITPIGGALAWLAHLPKATLLAETDDSTAMGKSLDALVKFANAAFAAGDPATMPRLVPLTAPLRGYALHLPTHLPTPPGFRPSILLSDKYLVISTSLETARAAVAVQSNPAGRLAPALDGQPKGLVYLNVTDPRDSMPELIANTPFLVQMLGMASTFDGPGAGQAMLAGIRFDNDLVPSPADLRRFLFPGSMACAVDEKGIQIVTRESIPSVNSAAASPIAVALLLPAVKAARTAAQRTQSTNNLKQIALAMHNYHDTYNHFPPAAICDKDGKPLLSWRVALLPYLDQSALYNEFHLDEPWDSEHNKPLLDKLPAVYAPLNVTTQPPNQTFYQVFVGKGALFNKVEGVRLADIIDGTSNTLLCVEAGKSVPWSKPEDIAYDPEKPLPKFGGLNWPGGFNAAFADGSVRFIKDSIEKQVLHALITRAGGEVVDF